MTREQRLKKRYTAEKRFRLMGIGAIAIAIFFVFLLLLKVFSTGSTAFVKTTIQTEVDFNKELLELKDVANPNIEQIKSAEFFDVTYKAATGLFPYSNAEEEKDVKQLLSGNYELEIKNYLINNPDALGKKVMIDLTASDDLDQLHKGNFPRDIPEDRRRLNNFQLNIYDNLLEQGKIKTVFSNYFLFSGDSRDPEIAGVAGAGGDGTFQEVINGISKTTVVAIIPLGTANIVAIESGVTKNINHLCKIILKGKIKKIHVPTINNRKFILMAGIGFDAFIVKNINNNLKKIFGKIIFFIETVKQFFILQKPTIKIIANKKTFFGNWVLITNACHYAGPHQITKQANIFTPNLVGYIFTNLTRVNFLYSVFLIIFFGDLSKSKNIITVKSNEFKITANQNIPVQCDGEIFNKSTLLIKNSKSLVNLLT